MISSFNVIHHLYADDTQIYLALYSMNFDSSIAELTECLACVQKWMDGVRLELNPEKTEFTVIGDRQARESIMQKFPTQFLGHSISPSDHEVKNLGVTSDSGNTFASSTTEVVMPATTISKISDAFVNSFAMSSPTEWNRLPQSVRSQNTIIGF